MAQEALPETIKSFLDAVNRHDEAAFLEAFGTGGGVDDWGRKFVGPTAIKGWSDREFLGKDVSLEVTGVETSGNTVSILTQVGGSGFTGPSRFTFRLDGNHIQWMIITAD